MFGGQDCSKWSFCQTYIWSQRRCCANHATDVLHDAISGNNNLTNVPGNGRFIGSCSEQGDGSTNDEQGLKRKQILHHLSVAASETCKNNGVEGRCPKNCTRSAELSLTGENIILMPRGAQFICYRFCEGVCSVVLVCYRKCLVYVLNDQSLIVSVKIRTKIQCFCVIPLLCDFCTDLIKPNVWCSDMGCSI